jgi:hypothetical protein
MHANTHTKHSIHNLIENYVVTLFLEDYKDEKQKVLQKIEHVCGSVSLNDQRYSPRPRDEDLLWQLYACNKLQYGIQHLEAWTSHSQPSSVSLEREKK